MSVIYTRIESAIVERLRLGLGKAARRVESYGGELDDDMARTINIFPAVWVTFGGIMSTTPHSTARKKYLTTGKYVVMVGEVNVRNEASTRRGGAALDEVGTYPLLYAVRRLLSGQDLGMEIDHLRPTRVRTLFNTRIQAQAFSVFAAEFETKWIEEALDNGRFPAPENEADPDYLFVRHAAKLDEPYPDLAGIDITADLVGNK